MANLENRPANIEWLKIDPKFMVMFLTSLRLIRGSVFACFLGSLVLGLGEFGYAQDYPERTWMPIGSPNVEGAFLSWTAKTVTVRLQDRSLKVLAIDTLGDEDLRFLANVALVDHPFRVWTRTVRRRGGTTDTETFRASFKSVVGFDSPLSKRHVLVIRQQDGALRGYALEDLSSADRAYIESNSVKAVALKPDKTVYAVNWGPYSPQASPEPFNYKITQHFVFYWGNKVKPEVAQWNNPAFREMNFEYFEKVWSYFKSINATLPGWNEAQKKKTSVYITGTGLSKFPDGFAFGGESVVISPAAMLEGSSVVPHEFGHSMQLASGGFRDSAYVGWFWENHANWCAGSFIPGLALALGVYAERTNYELDSSRMNYGSWPFVEYFAEHPRFTRDIGFDVWRAALRNSTGAATESPLQTFMRLGVKQGAFSGDGVEGFGDMIGEMAAHNATWDYVYQTGYQDALEYLFTSGRPYRGQTMLQPVPDRAGWYHPIYSQSPRQYGYNVIPLVVSPGAREVTANLEGIVDEELGSDWRATLVALDDKGVTRYSRMWRTGKGTMPVRANDQLFLTICAAPKRFALQPFRPGYNKVKRHFPYEVSFTGCTPSAVPAGLRSHGNVHGHPHVNGGGFVADSASVAESAYVGPTAQVLDQAHVDGLARVEGHATIEGQAVVSGSAIVGDYACVRESARVAEQARVREYAVVQGRATISGRARVREFINVQGDGLIAGDAMVKGFGDVFTSVKSPVGGGTVIGQDSEIYLESAGGPVDSGFLYGFTSGDQFKERIDNNYAYAHWDFSEPRQRLLRDSLGDSDGVLRGGARITADGDKKVLALDGDDSWVALEGHTFDSSAITFQAQVKWDGGAADQGLLSFGDSESRILITPKNRLGNFGVSVWQKATRSDIQTDQALPVGKWQDLKVIVSRSGVAIWLGGVLVAQTQMPIKLEEKNIEAAYIGRDLLPRGFFKGEVANATVYHGIERASP